MTFFTTAYYQAMKIMHLSILLDLSVIKDDSLILNEYYHVDRYYWASWRSLSIHVDLIALEVLSELIFASLPALVTYIHVSYAKAHRSKQKKNIEMFDCN